jgi:hypothetical protein
LEIDIADSAERILTCVQRSTFDFVLEFFLDEEETDPDSIDGSSFYMQVRNKAGDEILSLSTTEGEGMTIENSNQLVIYKSAEDMDIPEGTYRYDLNEINYAGDDYRIMFGDFIVKKKQSIRNG